MALKQIHEYNRIIFLKKFTEELILNYFKEAEVKKRIETEKIKQKFFEPTMSPEEAFKKIIRSPLQPSIQKTKTEQKIYKTPAKIPKPKSSDYIKQPIFSELPISKTTGLNLGKIEMLLRDSGINFIECFGPGKELLIKKYNKSYRARISLTQNEILGIIDYFSKKAKIPIIKGIFRTAVGDLLISAIISDFVGSRFIITRITPYSVIENFKN